MPSPPDVKPADVKPETVYPACRNVLNSAQWDRITGDWDNALSWKTFPEVVSRLTDKAKLPAYLSELARLEYSLFQLDQKLAAIPQEVKKICVNPTLQLLSMSQDNLTHLLPSHKNAASDAYPKPRENIVLLWRNPRTDNVCVREADDEELLALKMIVENIDSQQAATDSNIPTGVLDAAIDRTVRKGILLAPTSRIRRNSATFPISPDIDEKFLTASVFTLQWHITQLCDLHCKHCYDRSNRTMPDFEQAVNVLDDLHGFCRNHHVTGQVSFTGGNPLLYPNFNALYREASKRDFSLAILGNPAGKERIDELLEIEKPVFYQVSLEGLKEHNDSIRGFGHFERTLHFLDILKEMNIFSMVMLTLTRDNMDQVLPLAEVLRRRTDLFTFNRLSSVGEGANLSLPDPDAYAAFLKTYLKAARANPIISLKDNLINICRHENQTEWFGGCAGYGCGAAFNFVSLLSDGEVHACRKFPSLIGHITEQNLDTIYHSAIAQRYRSGSQACRNCTIRPVCGGCLAVSHSHGLNIFEEKDPYCFTRQS